MQIVFKDLEKSELTRAAVAEKLGEVIEKFPKLEGHRIQVTLSMENSPTQPGADAFTVRVLIHGKSYRNLAVAKTHPHLYRALADVKEHLLEALNRAGDETRVLARKSSRRARQKAWAAADVLDSPEVSPASQES